MNEQAPPTQSPHPGLRGHARVWTMSAAIATGALTVIAAPGVLPWRWAGLIAWVSFAPLLWALRHLSVRQAIWHAWIAGLVFQVGAASWYPGLMARYSGMHPVWAVGLSLLVWSLQAMTWGLWGGIARYFGRAISGVGRLRSIAGALLVAASFVAIERFAPVVFRGPIALTQAHFPLVAQVAEPGGIHAVSFLILVTGFAIAHRRPLLLVVPALAIGVGIWRMGVVRAERNASRSVRVALVQEGRIPTGWSRPDEDKEVASRYQLSSSRLEKDQLPQLIVWPEKAWPQLIRHDAQHDYPVASDKRIRAGFSSPLIFGVTSVDVSTRQVRNSAAALDRQGRLSVFYDKVELIPYSESAYLAGTRVEPYVMDGVAVGAMICFESTLPWHARKLVARGAELLVNLTDDTWFGASSEPEQHFAHAVFRAIETRRDVVRASAAGPSGCIAATGEVEARASMGQGRLVCEARILKTRGRGLGDMFSYLCLSAGLAAGLVIECRRRWKQEVRPRRSPE